MDGSHCERLQEKLSDYLDDELGASDRELVRAHLEICAECRETLASYRRVVGYASALEDRSPPADLWPDVAARIGARVPATAPGVRVPVRRRWFRAPQLLAAGIGFAAVATGAFLLTDEIDVTPIATAPVDSEVRNVGFEEPVSTRYDAAIDDLVAALDQERETLDPQTVRIVEENLAVIDRALGRALAALRADPESDYLREHLENTKRQKLEVLQRVAVLASEL